jgi:DNA-binding winged helix-turn-helix (wHTH) protein
MRLLIAKLVDAAHHSVALALASAHDVAELVESVDDCVARARASRFDLVILIAGPNPQAADVALARLRALVPLLAVVLLSDARAIERPGLLALGGPPHHSAIALDAVRRRVSAGGLSVALSQAEFRIFAVLWQRRGRTVSSADLLDALYPDGERPGSRVLPVFLFKLRHKLKRVGLEDFVQTAAGGGFTIPACDSDAAAAVQYSRAPMQT